MKGPDFLKQADYLKINDEIRKANYKSVPPPSSKAELLNYLVMEKRKPLSYDALKICNLLPAFRTKYINCDKKNVSLFNVKQLYCYNVD